MWSHWAGGNRDRQIQLCFCHHAAMGRHNSSSHTVSPHAPSVLLQANMPRRSNSISFPLHPLQQPWVPGATVGSWCHWQCCVSAAWLAITTGKAVTLQQTSLLSPATNQGQAAALLDRACRYVLLLLMSSCHTLNGDTQESNKMRQRISPAAHMGAPALRASPLPPAELRVSTREARPGMFSSPGLLWLYL